MAGTCLPVKPVFVNLEGGLERAFCPRMKFATHLEMPAWIRLRSDHAATDMDELAYHRPVLSVLGESDDELMVKLSSS